MAHFVDKMNPRFFSRTIFHNDFSILLMLWAVYVFIFGEIWYVRQSSLGAITGVSIVSAFGIMLLIRVFKGTLERASFAKLPSCQLTGARLFVYVVGSGFIAGELALGLLFLPFSYTTQATLLILALFLFWRILKFWHTHQLTPRTLAREIGMVGCAYVFILVTTPWLPR